MTIKELITTLQKYNPETEIIVFDSFNNVNLNLYDIVERMWDPETGEKYLCIYVD